MASATGCSSPERADAIRAAADLHAPDQPSLDPDQHQQHAADERQDADRADQRAGRVRHPVLPDDAIEERRLLRVEHVELHAQLPDGQTEVADVVPLAIEASVDHDVADGSIDGEEPEREDGAADQERRGRP